MCKIQSMNSRPRVLSSVLVLIVVLGYGHGKAFAQEPALPTEQIVCQYARLPERMPFAALNPEALSTASETEPNDTITDAQEVPLGKANGQELDVDLTGEIKSFDKDIYKFQGSRGQILGIASLAVDGNLLDSKVSILGPDGTLLVLNEDHQLGGSNIADLYPPESPLPAGGFRRDSVISYVFPKDGTYFVQVAGNGAAAGKYAAQLRLRDPSLAAEPNGTRQILFLDFDGATVDGKVLFGDGGNPNATLSPFKTFLAKWNVPAAKEDEIIKAIVANVQQQFDQLLAPVRPAVDIQILNSKEHSDEFGSNPYVSRVIIGGTIAELGVSTIGIAECIDPGNFSHNDTAVVLLDLLSAPPSNPNSILGLGRDSSVSLEDAIARVVASIACHEAGHFLGCWHTENSNFPSAIMDRGGELRNSAGVGTNLVLDSTDPLNHFVKDFYANEGVCQTSNHENCNHRVLNALHVGTAPTANPSESSVETLLTNLRERSEVVELPVAEVLNTSKAAVGIEVGHEELIAEDFRLLKAIDEAQSKEAFLKGL